MKQERKMLRRVIPFGKIVAKYRELRSPNHEPKSRGMLDRQEAARGNDGWTGASGSDMMDRLDNGYDFDMGSLPDLPVDLEGRGPRWTFNDAEGDYLHEEFLAGEPDFYVDRVQEDSKPGIYVHVECTFSAGINHETITAYGQWVGAAVSAIQAQGYDIALRITSTVDSLYQEEQSFRHETAIQVTRFGEKLLAREYAVLFSPGGYRHLMFLANCIPEVEPVAPVGHEGSYDKLLTTAYGLGHCISQMDWGVEFDPEERILHVTCSQMQSRFPEAAMDEMLREVQETF